MEGWARNARLPAETEGPSTPREQWYNSGGGWEGQKAGVDEASSQYHPKRVRALARRRGSLTVVSEDHFQPPLMTAL